jgi:hypothetical protein
MRAQEVSPDLLYSLGHAANGFVLIIYADNNGIDNDFIEWLGKFALVKRTL